MMKLELTEKEQVWEALITPPELEVLPTYGDLMEISEFVSAVRAGVFVPSDGTAHWATKANFDLFNEIPLRMLANGTGTWPRWATHVIWFNV